MARLVGVRLGENPDDDRGTAQWAFFEGTPSLEELRAAAEGCNEAFPDDEFRREDDVTCNPKLERWLVGW